MHISLLQWNIWYREDIHTIARFIRQVRPDVVCLQELTRNFPGQTETDTVAYLAHTLGYNQAAQYIPHPDLGWDQANAILSAYELSGPTPFWVNEPTGAGGYDDEARGYLEATVKTPAGELRVGTTHLSYTRGFAPTPRKDAETDRLAEIVGRNQGRFVLTGDMNALPDSYTIKRLSKLLHHAGPPLSATTWTTKPFNYDGFEAHELRWRLDYVFTTPDIRVLSAELLPTQYSDHLPILVHVEL